MRDLQSADRDSLLIRSCRRDGGRGGAGSQRAVGVDGEDRDCARGVVCSVQVLAVIRRAQRVEEAWMQAPIEVLALYLEGKTPLDANDLSPKEATL